MGFITGLYLFPITTSDAPDVQQVKTQPDPGLVEKASFLF